MQQKTSKGIGGIMSRIQELEKQIEILWSYIPESDYELNEKISKEINKLEEE